MISLIQSFGLTVRQLREARGWSQERLAEHADLDRSYIGEIERGNAIASLATVEKLARSLELTPSALLHNCEKLHQQCNYRLRLTAIAC